LGTGGGDRRAWILLAALVALPVATIPVVRCSLG